jgi:long-chain acyl-CoA synthetase
MSECVLESRNLLQDLDHWAAERPTEPWLVEQWSTHQREISWQQGVAEVHAAAAWLANQNPEPGRRIGLLAPNCAHWMLADYAIMASGNVTVPLFTTMDADNIAFAADFSGIDMLLLGNAANWESVKSGFRPDIPVVLLPGALVVSGAHTWEQIVDAGSDLSPPAPREDTELATIVFTSGTTGRPKGVMHSLSSLREAGGGVGLMGETQPGCRFISYLPLAHLGERIVVQTHAAVFGGTVYFNESQESFLDDMRNARPNWMLGVPRIWEKLQQVVLAHLVSLEELEAAKSAGTVEAVAAKVSAFLGLDEAHYILTSTAPTPAPLKAWYDDLGIILYDGYGQSEILPVCGNVNGNRKVESIGIASPGVEIKIAEDGEILARGGGTALGYYDAPDKTAETFEADGWVHTGDRGRFDEDGHLYITGRVKEIFKTAKGKYVAPAPIEGQFLDTPLAEQACLTGHGLAQTVMITVLSAAAAQLTDEEASTQLADWVKSINTGLEKHERIGAVIASRTPWAQENGVLTHTLKIKRDAVEDRYSEELEQAGDRMRHGEGLFVIPVA